MWEGFPPQSNGQYMINHLHGEGLKNLTVDTMRKVRLELEPLLRRWDNMCPEDQDHYIATEVMGWTLGSGEIAGLYITEAAELLRVEDFKPTECLTTAHYLFEFFLTPDKVSIQPCGSAAGLFWMVYFKDTYIAAGKRLQQALCKSCIVMRHAITLTKENPVQGGMMQPINRVLP